jgi:general secretion pathway protein D
MLCTGILPAAAQIKAGVAAKPQPAVRPSSPVSPPTSLPPPPTVPPTSGTATSPSASAAQSAKASTDDLPLPGAAEFLECKAFPPNKKVNFNLKPEAELTDLVGFIKAISCRPIILPQNIRQSKVTVIAPETVTASEAYRIFLSSLESMGLTVQPDGKVLKIIESNRAREASIPVISPGDVVPREERYVTRLLRLKYITADDVVQVLNRLKGRDGDIMPYAAANTLVVTDLASNIRRMEEVVRALDQPMAGEKIWVIRLKNIVATEVLQMLQQVFGVGKASSPGQPRRAPIQVSGGGEAPAPSMVGSGDDSISQIFADDRTNSIILVSAERTYQRVFALIKRLEQQGSTSTGDRIHVYALENANADDMVQVLGGLGISVSAGASRGRSGRGFSPPPQSSGGAQGSSGAFQDEVKVTPDKATNSLVILATGKDFLTLRDVIRRLDVPRRQVFIEAMVMEVSISKSRDLGLSYHGAIPGLGGLVVGGLQAGNLRSLSPLSLLSAQGLVGGLVGPQITGSTIFGSGTGGSALPPQFGILLQALQTNNDVNVMQVPNILTTDNEKSTITVGQNLPFPSAITGGLPMAGQSGSMAGFAALQSVQRQDVQLKIEVTPHVSASETVRMELKTEISDVAADNYNNLGPATNKRTLETTAVVRDQQPVVLGGIMRDKVSEAVTKIPILGDIPILGYLFKTRNKKIDKQMLLIVLTPYVINDPSELSRIFERKTRERREFLEAYATFSDERDLVGPIDYTKKRGALEEINRTAVESERELVELRTAEQSLHREVVDSGPVELPPGTRSNASPGATQTVSPSVSSTTQSPSSPPPPATVKPIAPPPPGAPPG